jgi:hypothetical protein
VDICSLARRQRENREFESKPDSYSREWKYFSTDQTVDLEDHTAQGVKLPPAVLVKLYHQNPVRWLTGTGW